MEAILAFIDFTSGFVDRPAGKLALINTGIALGLFIAYRHGQRGLDLLILSIVSIVVLNAVVVVGILLSGKKSPGAPNRFLKPLWFTVGILWLIYLLDYLFPLK